MNLGKRLHELQQIDLHLEKTTQQLLELERELSGNPELENAKAQVQRSRQQLTELQSKQKSAEWLVEDLQAKLEPLQYKLYAGSVHNPKDLLNLQQQVTQLKSQVREEEDKVLEIMDQVETLQKQISSGSAHVSELEKQWEITREQLVAQQSQLKEGLQDAKNSREDVAKSLDPDHLLVYESIRARKQGQAVAKIEQGRCQGCRIAVPVSELTQARAGELVQCGSCGRVLCLG